MRCISVRQPWAYLILEGGKNVENRTWRTGYRGPLLIHASRQWASHEPGSRRQADMVSAIRIEGKLVQWPPNLPRGAIVGMVELVGYASRVDNPWAEPGMCYWLLEDPLPFPEPIPYRGKQGLFRVLDELVAGQIEAARVQTRNSEGGKPP